MSRREGRVWGGRRGIVGTVAALGVGAVMLVGSGAAQAKGVGSTTCTGTIGTPGLVTTIDGNLTVAPGADCTLNDVVVDGNVSVDRGASLVVDGVNIGVDVDGNVSVGQGASLLAAGLVITRNLSAEDASAVNLDSGLIDGNTRVDGSSGPGALPSPADFDNLCAATGLFPVSPSVCFVGTTFGGTAGGNVSITNTSPGAVGIARSEISRNLSCIGNAVIDDPVQVSVDGHASGQCASF